MENQNNPTPSYDREYMTDREKIQALILSGIRNKIWSDATLEDLFNEVDRMMALITIKSEAAER